MEGDAEQAALAAGREPLGDVDEWRREQDAVLDDPDRAALFDDEQPTRAVAGAKSTWTGEASPDTTGVRADADALALTPARAEREQDGHGAAQAAEASDRTAGGPAPVAWMLHRPMMGVGPRVPQGGPSAMPAAILRRC